MFLSDPEQVERLRLKGYTVEGPGRVRVAPPHVQGGAVRFVDLEIWKVTRD